MDKSLFNKYINSVKKHKDNKEEIILHIKKETGVELNTEAVTILKKEIKIETSSAIRNKLFQKNIKSILLKKGFILK